MGRLLVAGSVALGAAGVAVTWLSLHSRPRAACWLLLAIQAPASLYDVVTRQFGFLVLTAAAVYTAVPQLRRAR